MATDRARKATTTPASITEIEMMQNRPTPDRVEDMPAEEFPTAMVDLQHGDVVIAAITTCTNTSNPSVMLAAGLLAKKAVEKGLTRPPDGEDLARARLARRHRVSEQDRPAALPRRTRASRPSATAARPVSATPARWSRIWKKTITDNDLVVASVLSGNRNFEARVHQNVKANFLMSPPLVVAFALAGPCGHRHGDRAARQGQGRRGRST